MEDIIYIVIVAVSLIGLLSGLILKKLERSIVTEPLIALCAGIVIAKLGYVIPDLHQLTFTVAKYTIVIAVTASALRIPKVFLQKFRWESTIILIVGMLGMWTMTAVILKFAFNYNWLYCFLLAAILTPTDPVISSAVISGSAAKETLPARIRQSISFESGANDGLAFVIVALPLAIVTSNEQALQDWAVQSVVIENLAGALFGLLVGIFIGEMVHKAHQMELMTSKSLLASALFLAFFVFSISEILGFNSIIAVFAVALTYGFNVNKGEELKQEKVQDALERIFVLPVFVLFGMILPMEEWMDDFWRYVYLALAILVFRRIPVFLLLRPFLRKFRSRFRDILFMGWFGPIGVAAIFYAMHTEKQLTAFSDDIWPVVSFIVFSSVVIHGITAYPVAKLYSFINEDDVDEHDLPDDF